MKKKNGKPTERAKCELFGDIHRIAYSEKRKRMEASVLLAPFEVKNLLDCISNFYAAAKTKRRQRIKELAEELGKLIYEDSAFFFEGMAFVSKGYAVKLGTDASFLETQEAQAKG